MNILVYIRNFSLGSKSFRTVIINLTKEQEAQLAKKKEETYAEGYILEDK